MLTQTLGGISEFALAHYIRRKRMQFLQRSYGGIEHPHRVRDELVLLAAVQKLLYRYHTIAIGIHFLEYLLHFTLDLSLVRTTVLAVPHQQVYGRHDVSHFLSGYFAIVIDVVKGERPAELLLQRAPGQYRQALDKVLEA